MKQESGAGAKGLREVEQKPMGQDGRAQSSGTELNSLAPTPARLPREPGLVGLSPVSHFPAQSQLSSLS